MVCPTETTRPQSNINSFECEMSLKLHVRGFRRFNKYFVCEFKSDWRNKDCSDILIELSYFEIKSVDNI